MLEIIFQRIKSNCMKFFMAVQLKNPSSKAPWGKGSHFFDEMLEHNLI